MASYDRDICTPASFGDNNSLNVNAIAHHRLIMIMLLSASSASIHSSAFTINVKSAALPTSRANFRPQPLHGSMMLQTVNAPLPESFPAHSSSPNPMHLCISPNGVFRTDFRMTSTAQANPHFLKLDSDNIVYLSDNAKHIVPTLTEFSPAVSSPRSMGFCIFANRAMNAISLATAAFRAAPHCRKVHGDSDMTGVSMTALSANASYHTDNHPALSFFDYVCAIMPPLSAFAKALHFASASAASPTLSAAIFEFPANIAFMPSQALLSVTPHSHSPRLKIPSFSPANGSPTIYRAHRPGANCFGGHFPFETSNNRVLTPVPLRCIVSRIKPNVFFSGSPCCFQ